MVSADFWKWSNIVERFWNRTKPISTGCIEWTGSRLRNGYGMVHLRNRKVKLAHRFSWEANRGPIPGNLWVLHTCDNRLCIRPDHLYLGTPKQNSRDMVERGRVAINRGSAKLCAEDASRIRVRRGAGERIEDLAAEYGVHRNTIKGIVHYRTWR